MRRYDAMNASQLEPNPHQNLFHLKICKENQFGWVKCNFLHNVGPWRVFVFLTVHCKIPTHFGSKSREQAEELWISEEFGGSLLYCIKSHISINLCAISGSEWIVQSRHPDSQTDSIVTEWHSRRELSGLLSRWTWCCESETRRLVPLSLLQISAWSPNTQQKVPLCGPSPAPSVSANRHCLRFPPAACLQNDYCMAHTIC